MKPDNSDNVKILWWNVNRRLNEIVKNISPIITERPDIVFVFETATGYGALPDIELYNKYADKDVKQLNHGGVVLYISKKTIALCF